MKSDRGVRSVIAAILGSIASFCLVAIAIYYKVADVRVNGVLHGGPPRWPPRWRACLEAELWLLWFWCFCYGGGAALTTALNR